MSQCSFAVRFARRIPDPVIEGADRHIFLCSVLEVPRDLPCDASNVRAQNIDRLLYKEIARHLRNEDGHGTPNTFHLKNKGITLLADRVQRVDDTHFDVFFDGSHQGVVDGGHTYKIILENLRGIREANELNDQSLVDQYVKFEVLTGLHASLATEIAGGLNTALQVNEMALANHAGKLDWIKEELDGEPYLSQIVFRQNEEGIYDAADIIRILELFNIERYPYQAGGGSTHPIRAYTGKENVLAYHLKHPEQLQRLRPIMKDILVLHDTISSQAAQRWTSSVAGRKGAALAFIENTSKERPWAFPFIGEKGTTRLYMGVLFSILAAFRWMVVIDKETGVARWRGEFADVMNLWEATAPNLLALTKETSDELSRNPNAIGKSSNHWGKLALAVVAHRALIADQ